MDENLKRDLESLFNDNAQRAKAVEIKRNLEAEAQAAALDQFLQVRQDVIIPALQEFADFIRPHGWDARLEEGDEIVREEDHRGNVTRQGQSAFVKLDFDNEIYRKAARGIERLPSFTITVDKAGRSVGFHENTIGPGHGGSAGGGGSAKLDQLTKEFVQARVGAYFKKLMDNARPNER